jgi:sugar lactone lactonase YvrE
MIAPVALDDLRPAAAGLHRPECIVATRSGDLFASDKRGGVLRIAPDGSQTLIGTGDIEPNGIALLSDRSFLVANVNRHGGIWKISGADADADVRPFVMEVDGRPLPAINFVLLDQGDRLWATVLSAGLGAQPASHAPSYVVDKDLADGFVMLIEHGKARIVADGLSWTNECRVHPDGKRLFVIETFGRRLTSFDIADNGDLSNRTTIHAFGAGDYPDGLAFDSEGAVWVASVISNRVYRITADGEAQVVLSDPDAKLDELEAALQEKTLTRALLRGSGGRRLNNITSVAFGGPDLKTVYLGTLAGTVVESFRSPVAGLPPIHWDW